MLLRAGFVRVAANFQTLNRKGGGESSLSAMEKWKKVPHSHFFVKIFFVNIKSLLNNEQTKNYDNHKGRESGSFKSIPQALPSS